MLIVTCRRIAYVIFLVSMLAVACSNSRIDTNPFIGVWKVIDDYDYNKVLRYLRIDEDGFVFCESREMCSADHVTPTFSVVEDLLVLRTVAGGETRMKVVFGRVQSSRWDVLIGVRYAYFENSITSGIPVRYERICALSPTEGTSSTACVAR